ncbi:MAG: type II secretion system F family protein [Gemmatimonadota bacterium]
MTYVIAVLVMTSVMLVVFVAAVLVPARGRAIEDRLASLELERDRNLPRRVKRSREKRRQIEALMKVLGETIASRREDTTSTWLMLARAGYRRPNAVAIYYTTRVLLVAGLAFGGMTLASILGSGAMGSLFAAGVAALVGWLLPQYVIRRRTRQRAKQIQLSLPDMLDMMVVCVEAGLGLNQAMQRVAEELGTMSPALSEELQLTNLEIQTGMPREEALRNLGERAQSPDLKSLVAMLIQTDRFGTSIARALRVHSRTLRTKRRQRAEEQAAKTTIKLVFPLVIFIFPALLVVILGPAILHIIRTLGGLV